MDMVYILAGVIGILTILLSGSGVMLYEYRRNVRSILRQLQEIKEIETNQLVYIEGSNREIAALINEINAVILGKRESVIKTYRLNRRFRQSITNLSHDLRTPLTTAGGYIEMLREDISAEEKLEYIHIISERQEMVRMLLEQLFEYARLESGEITYETEKTDVKKVFIDVLTMYYDDFSKREEEPQVKVPDEKVWVMGDEKGFKRIFSNIIFNALVHGAGDYHFSIAPKDNGYEFVFRNASEPLTLEELDYLFDRFYVKDVSRNSKTTGLGLSIAKEITQRFQGRICAKYQNGHLAICIWFPKGERETF